MLEDRIHARSGALPQVSTSSRRISGAPTPTQVGARTAAARLGSAGAVWLVLVDCAALLGAALAVDPIGRVSATALVILVLSLNAATGLYRPLIAPTLLDELPGLTARALIAGAVVTAVCVYLEPSARAAPVIAALVFLALACTGRILVYVLLRRWRTAHPGGRPAIIVGSGTVADRLSSALIEHPEFGMSPLGFVDDEPLPASDQRLQLLGNIDSLPGLVGQHHVCDVIVAGATRQDSGLVDVLRRCDRLAGEVFVLPRLHEIQGRAGDVSINCLPLTRLPRSARRCISWRLKRAFDIVAASLGLVLLSPVLALCALAVYVEGGPGVIFRQERVGMDGRRFEMLKFRSLAPQDVTESEQRWTIRADPRLGPVGRLLRRSSLDELPQLWNVICGDMSLVGPRPERPFFVHEFARSIRHYDARHRVPAGLTGWAQVSGLRGDTDISERARFDNYYIENWSLWTDIKILVRTTARLVGRG
jgi:exopolysaccharide biosynthesis polyprenyl glycosylphosphotransferase